jgi:prepilin-type N-terminal cleavage/methylation domain-containing protein
MKKAFTLVEMLIVVIIIGILAVALVPKLTAIQ